MMPARQVTTWLLFVALFTLAGTTLSAPLPARNRTPLPAFVLKYFAERDYRMKNRIGYAAAAKERAEREGNEVAAKNEPQPGWYKHRYLQYKIDYLRGILRDQRSWEPREPTMTAEQRVAVEWKLRELEAARLRGIKDGTLIEVHVMQRAKPQR